MVIGEISKVLDIFFKKLQPPRTVTRVVPSTTLPPYTLPSHRVHSTDDIVPIQSMSSRLPQLPQKCLFFPFLAQDYLQNPPHPFFFGLF